MKLHVFVEGRSEEALLLRLLPRLCPEHGFQIYPHRGRGQLAAQTAHSRKKTDQPPRGRDGLLDRLPQTLTVFGRLDPQTDRVVVLLDLDAHDDCRQLLDRLHALREEVAPRLACLFRLAIEETEAWYLGDLPAVKRAFKGQKLDLAALTGYEPDGIGKTWERFAQLVRDPAERKVAWAERMGEHLSVAHEGRDSRSPSFRTFCAGVRRLAGEAAPATRRTAARATRAARAGTAAPARRPAS